MAFFKGCMIAVLLLLAAIVGWILLFNWFSFALLLVFVVLVGAIFSLARG